MEPHPACNGMNIYSRQKSTYITCSLQLHAVMLLYINQQLNVILYTYIFKRNSNQSLELNNPSARENDFQNIKLHMQTQGHWATKEQTLFHRDKGLLLYNYLWGQRSRCSHRQSNNYFWSNCIDHLHMDPSETFGFGLEKEISVNSTGNQWQSQVRAGKFSILEQQLTDFISCKWKWKSMKTSVYFDNSYSLL